jgi:hypothetical protein
MELSNFTVQTLKNFASINPNLVIRGGNTIMTMSDAKNILAQVSVSEDFPQEFGIYDLNEFLSVIGLFETSNLKFEESNIIVSDTSGRSKIKYFYSDIEMLTTPTKALTMPSTDVSFILDNNTLNNLKRAAAALGHTEVSITGGNNLITLTVVDNENTTSNSYSIDVDGSYNSEDFNFILNINNLRMIPGDYQVDISSKLISQFTNTSEEQPIKYWVALEKTSTYN